MVKVFKCFLGATPKVVVSRIKFDRSDAHPFWFVLLILMSRCCHAVDADAPPGAWDFVGGLYTLVMVSSRVLGAFYIDVVWCSAVLAYGEIQPPVYRFGSFETMMMTMVMILVIVCDCRACVDAEDAMPQSLVQGIACILRHTHKKQMRRLKA